MPADWHRFESNWRLAFTTFAELAPDQRASMDQAVAGLRRQAAEGWGINMDSEDEVFAFVLGAVIIASAQNVGAISSAPKAMAVACYLALEWMPAEMRARYAGKRSSSELEWSERNNSQPLEDDMEKTTQAPIQEDLWNANQSWNYERVQQVEGHHFRVRIRRNAYDHQSHATCERWDGDRWRQVISRPIEEMTCSAVSYVTKSPDQLLFQDDACELIALALKVVA